MTTVRESLDALPVAELAEVREKLRLNAEEREALEARAKQLLEAWTAVALPPPPPPPAPAPPAAPQIPLVQTAETYAGLADRAVRTINANPGRSLSAVDLGDMWGLTHEDNFNAIRSGLARAVKQGLVRRVAHGRYTSIHSAPGVR